MNECVWAFQPLPELSGATGFVECDAALAAELLAAGKVQNPRIGGTALNYITDVPPPPDVPPPAARDVDYSDKEALPKRRR